MSSDDARDLFSEAFDGELDEAQQAAFDAALDADSDLRADYDDFAETFMMVGALDEKEPLPAPDLLPQIQDRLRRRSRGRYYRDRFSRNAGRLSWMVMLLAAATVVAIAGAAFYAMQTHVLDVGVELIAPGDEEPTSAEQAPATGENGAERPGEHHDGPLGESGSDEDAPGDPSTH